MDVYKVIENYADRIYHVHLKDHIGIQSVPFGKGEVDNAGYIKALKDVGYEGYLSIELEVEDVENAPRYVEEAKNLIESFM